MSVPIRRGPGIGGHDRSRGQALVQLVEHASRIHSVLDGEHGLGLHLSLPRLHAVGDLLLPRQVRGPRQLGYERCQRRSDVAPQVQLRGVAQAHVLGFEIDLERSGLTAAGQELAVGVVGPEHHERVAAAHLLQARETAEESELLGVVGNLRGDDVLAAQRRDDACAAEGGRLEDLVGRSVGPVADQEGDPPAGVDDLGRASDVRSGRRDRCRGGDGAGPRDGGRGRLHLGHLHGLDVVRKDHHSGAQAEPGGAEGGVEDRLRLGGCDDGLHVDRDIGEGPFEIALLLHEGAEGRGRLLPDDRDHRLVVHLRVVEPVEHVESSGAGGGHAHPDLAGELRMCGRHEGAGLLMGGPHVLQAPIRALRRAERAVERADPVSRVPEDTTDPPLSKSLDHEVADGRCHCGSSSLRWGCRTARSAGRQSCEARGDRADSAYPPRRRIRVQMSSGERPRATIRPDAPSDRSVRCLRRLPVLPSARRSARPLRPPSGPAG